MFISREAPFLYSGPEEQTRLATALAEAKNIAITQGHELLTVAATCHLFGIRVQSVHSAIRRATVRSVADLHLGNHSQRLITLRSGLFFWDRRGDSFDERLAELRDDAPLFWLNAEPHLILHSNVLGESSELLYMTFPVGEIA